MGKGRLEAFSDAVIAIIMTIMVLELRPPEGATFESLRPLIPVFASYVLSFTYIGIYWNNHHHLLHATKTVSGSVLWANLLLLFSLSLFPFATAWLGEHHASSQPAAAYGAVCCMAAISYTLLVRALIAHDGPDSTVARATGKDIKGWGSLALYVAAIALAFVNPLISEILYVVVALIWFIPDRRIERALRP